MAKTAREMSIKEYEKLLGLVSNINSTKNRLRNHLVIDDGNVADDLWEIAWSAERILEILDDIVAPS